MGFWSWLTGHDEKESDLYANYEIVGEVTDELNRIATQEIGKAAEEVAKAIQQLNSAKGFEMVAEPIDVAAYDSIFESIGQSIKDVGTQLNEKAENIKTYEESSPLEKFGSTLCMGVFKVGEGLLSVAEDLGDAVVSVVGWGAGALGADGFQEDCANFVKKEWSHDVFNFYYNSEFAKKSAFTEDSAIAGGLKIAGKTVGYLYAGGAISGAMGWGSATNMGIGALKASGTTWGATIASGLGGLGSSTESGLNQGLTYNQAMGQGLKGGLTSAALAFAGGKLSETMQAHTALKAAASSSDDVTNALVNSSDDLLRLTANSSDDVINAAANSSDDILRAAANSTDDVANAAANSTDDLVNAAANSTDEAAGAAKEAGKVTWKQALKESSNYQGYDDAVTRAGVRFGEAQRGVVSSAKNLMVAKSGLKAGDPEMQLNYDVAKQNFKESVSTLAKENPLAQGYNATLGKAVNGAKQFGTSVSQNGVKQTLANGATSAKNGVKGVISNVKADGLLKTAANGVKSVGSTALKVATNPMTYSVGATVLGSAIKENEQKDGWTVQDMAQNDPNVKLMSNLTGEDAVDVARERFHNGGYGIGDRTSQTEEPSTQTPDTTPTPSSTPFDQTPTEEPTTQTPDTTPYNPSTPTSPYNPSSPTTPYAPTTPITTPTTPITTPTTPVTKPYETTPKTVPTTPVTTPTTPKTVPTTPVTSPKTVPKTNPVTVPTTPYETTPKTTPYNPVTTPKTTPYTPVTSPKTTPKYGYDKPNSSDTTGKHTGGGYGEDGYSSFDLEDSDKLSELDELVKSGSSIDEIIKNSKYAKIPSSTKPIKGKSSGKSSAIPIAAGLSVAAAAGIGAKAYIDHKNQDAEEDEFADEEFSEDDDFETDDWMPDIDELEIGEEDPNAAGFGDNDIASTVEVDGFAEV